MKNKEKKSNLGSDIMRNKDFSINGEEEKKMRGWLKDFLDEYAP